MSIYTPFLAWVTDPDTGETALKPVVQTFRNETEEWIHVTVNGETLTCTPEHPFYSPVKGWTSACDLRAGDILVMLNGEYVVVEQVQHELLESPETTYNFEVEDYHTYYVGDGPVLVHNKCGDVYRGGDYTARDIDVRVDKSTNLLKPTRGISVNSDPGKVARFGTVSRVDSLPQGLSLRQIGTPGHFEITPQYPMSFSNYQKLLNQIKYTIVRR